MTGHTISHFKILQKLGGGGMGVVYKAEDTNLKRIVALKLLPLELTNDPESKERLLREAQAGSAFQHQNICSIHEIGETEDGQMFICMDYYDGKTLKEKLDEIAEKSTQPMPVSEALDISIQIAQGLSKAHEKGIIHRDIKPANIIITDEGVVKILDFGLARLSGKSKITQTGKAIGTITYLSPEQAEGRMVDHRTDIWSLGVVLYEMCTGKLPFESEYDAALIYAILDKTPVPPSLLCGDIPKYLEQIILKCLEKNPNDRYPNIEELLSDLNRTKEGLSEKAETSLLKKENTKPHGVIRKIESIAVLPLENLSNDKEQEYFVSGIHEELLKDLTKIKALRVISRTSVMQYRNTKKSASEIARELNVNALIEGSVLNADNHVRISVQLIDGRTDKHLWAESYDRDLKNILTMLSEVGQAIAEEIAVKISQKERNRFFVPCSVNPEVQMEYFRGRYSYHQFTYQGSQDALIHFKRCTEIDSNFAPGYAGQAAIYFLQGFLGFKPYPEVFPISRSLALKAININDELAEAHTVMGCIKLSYDWEWQDASKELERALDLDPNDVIARHVYGDYLTIMGHPEAGLKQINLGKNYDPFSPIALIPTIYHLIFLHQYDEIINECKKLFTKFPNMTGLRNTLQDALWLKGNYEESYKEFLKTYAGDIRLKRALEQGYKLSGPAGAVIELAKILTQTFKPYTGTSLTIASLYALVNEKELTLEWLEKAYEEHAPFLIHLKAHPVFDFISSDPRYHLILQKIGFPETEKE
jgi:serine/threonine protein kinase